MQLLFYFFRNQHLTKIESCSSGYGFAFIMNELSYLSECIQYEDNKSNGECLFSKYILKSGNTFDLHALGNYSFIFVLSGKLRLLHTPDMILEEDNMYSLGYDVTAILQSLSDNCFLLLTFDRPLIISYESEIIELKRFLPEEGLSTYSLQMNETIRELFKSICFYLDNRSLSIDLHLLKEVEWFLLMREIYTKEQNAMFFYPLMVNNSFETTIRRKAKGVNTVTELAEACYMSPKTLTRKFKRSLHTTPKQWLLQQKKQIVRSEILQAVNLKELPDKLGFFSYAHLNKYCIKHLGMSIKELRRCK